MGKESKFQNTEGAIEEVADFDIGVLLSEIEKFNLRIMEISGEHPFAYLAPEGSFEVEDSDLSKGPGYLRPPQHGGEEHQAAEMILKKKEEWLSEVHNKFDKGMASTGLAFVEDTDYQFGRLRVYMHDPYLFVQYMEMVSANPKDSQIVGLQKFIASFDYELRHGGIEMDDGGVFVLDDEQNNLVVDLLAIRERFEGACKAIDPDNSQKIREEAHKIGILLDVAKQGYLREYLIAERHSMLAKPGDMDYLGDFYDSVLGDYADFETFGSGSNFDEDEMRLSALSNYKRVWDEIIHDARTIGKNARAAKLLSEVLANLDSTLTYSEDKIRANSDYSKEDVRVALLDYIQQTKEALRKIPFGENVPNVEMADMSTSLVTQEEIASAMSALEDNAPSDSFFIHKDVR